MIFKEAAALMVMSDEGCQYVGLGNIDLLLSLIEASC